MRDPVAAHREVWRRLAVLAAAPSVEGIVHRAGATLDIGEALAPGSRCTGVVVTDSTVPAVGEVEILQVLPATANELAWSRVHGSAALRERWASAGTDLRDLRRSAVDLR